MIPADSIKFWEFFDLYTLGALFIVVGILVVLYYRKTGSLLGTISQTVAHSKYSSLIFSIVMTVCFPLYYAFIWFWVGPQVHMSTGFYYLLAVSAIFEIIFVWVPATDGKKRQVHEIMSSLVGVAMFAAPLAILVYGTGVSMAGKVSILIFILTSIVLIGLLAVKKTRQYTFLYETIYCLVFLITISVIAHG